MMKLRDAILAAQEAEMNQIRTVLHDYIRSVNMLQTQIAHALEICDHLMDRAGDDITLVDIGQIVDILHGAGPE